MTTTRLWEISNTTLSLAWLLLDFDRFLIRLWHLHDYYKTLTDFEVDSVTCMTTTRLWEISNTTLSLAWLLLHFDRFVERLCQLHYYYYYTLRDFYYDSFTCITTTRLWPIFKCDYFTFITTTRLWEILIRLCHLHYFYYSLTDF